LVKRRDFHASARERSIAAHLDGKCSAAPLNFLTRGKFALPLRAVSHQNQFYAYQPRCLLKIQICPQNLIRGVLCRSGKGLDHLPL
jgi:hypothetical protein